MDDFMKGAFDTLVKRGVITSDKLEPSTVTDDMIHQLEQEMNITIPMELQSYLKAYSHSLNILGTPLPLEYLDDPDIMILINEKTPEELAALDKDDGPFIEVIWSEVLAIPKENPLQPLREKIKNSRKVASFVKDDEVTEASLQRFIPIADWFCAGPLCIDTARTKEALDYEDMDTWQLRWFDHEEMDWKFMKYIKEDGTVIGQPLFPDFETFIKLYFYGVCDQLFERQLIMEKEELPDKTTWSK
ncbi:hypothetical protein PIROE2DRAFT_64467 [Piromyces sp. E2]|nr:hypothetical protein PIROE2DRAFT_64467 [Piromyces sp. E2]|eukprot:OUM58347.1 hypothetical protein PIROE2DRAFT_64467 [Piromyces sp. E2]